MLVEIRNLAKMYGKKRALRGVSMDVEVGNIVGLFGPNGSGKTTIIKILGNLLMHYDGSVLIDGKVPGYETKSIVSYLPDVNYLDSNWTIEESLKIFKSFYSDFDHEKAVRLLKAFNLNLNDRISTLSKGNKEKVQIILVLSRNAKLYIFDEPIAGVDPASRDVIFHLIKDNVNKDSAVIITTHLISDIEEIVNHVIFIDEGKIFLNMSRENLMIKYPNMTIDQIFRGLFRIKAYHEGESSNV